MAKQEQQQWNACSNGGGGAIDNSSCISRSSSNGNSNGGLQLQSFFKSIFSKDNDENSFRKRGNESFFVKRDGGDTDDYGNDDDGSSAWAKLPVPHLSPLARSVISRCSKILQISPEDLYQCFDREFPDKVKQPSNHARNFLEFCSYQAIDLSTTGADYLSNKEFRRLMFDMMLAWESSGVENDLLANETTSCRNNDREDEDSWSFFYSSSTTMAVQVDDKKTVGLEAFARIAPACPIVADIITVHNLFDVLTSSSCGRLHFLIYDKYLRSLDKVIKAVSNGASTQFMSNLSLAEEEIILDIDGTIPTQPVLQHIGISAWPGRLTLTKFALYFESGVGLYDKAVRYDLSTDIKQVIKPELTGPLGARLFDKAVMYKSISMMEPVFFEFPEFKGSSRRDYWLDISLEILRAHRFTRKYNLKGYQKNEALARATLGILRYRAIREVFHIFSSNYKTVLCFNLAESLPGGDMILENLSDRFALVKSGAVRRDVLALSNVKKQMILPVSLLTLGRLGIISCKEEGMNTEATFGQGDICVGEISPLESAVKQLKQNTGRAEAAQATVDQVKVEGIHTNLAVMEELLYPLIVSFKWIQQLASWEEPWKSILFLVLTSFAILRGWINYILPSISVIFAGFMIWQRYTSKRRPLEAFKIKAPPSKNAVEQLVTLQEAVLQVEGLIQSGNVVLLKLRALLFAIVPQATDTVALSLIVIAVALAFVPLKYLFLLAFVESFTRNMPARKESSERWFRRMREWWLRIPAAPVQLVKVEDKKRK
ncbi:uncharacterized protein LOC113754101 [Coffea eugenioides]|uniref:uncharacterized protein LOC113754101 n=1 Tax=Coffea eugenioides TaxID=49369 RepID=UPI000F607971|nr:uncharacterized protein LOC113754101 [Coffea eugenioides]